MTNADPKPGDYNHDAERDSQRVSYIVTDAFEFATEADEPSSTIACEQGAAYEGLERARADEAGDPENLIAAVENLTGTVVALCKVSYAGNLIAARQVVCLERIAAALERAFPPPKPEAG